jgi:hypothetical protein
MNVYITERRCVAIWAFDTSGHCINMDSVCKNSGDPESITEGRSRKSSRKRTEVGSDTESRIDRQRRRHKGYSGAITK